MMPIRVDCPCGRQLRLKDDLLGMRIKCPDCGDALDVPDSIDADATLYPEEVSQAELEASELESDFEEEPQHKQQPRKKKQRRSKSTAEHSVRGKPSFRCLGLNLPGVVGSALCSIEEDRLVVQSNGWLSQRDCEVFLEEIHSVEVSTGRHPLLLILTLLTLAIYVWILFLVLYLVLRFRTLSVHAGGTTLSMVISKGDERATDFVDQIMASARDAKRNTN